MILSIYLYGQGVLRKEAQEINKDYPALQELIGNMFQTMYHAEGIGLAGPQVGLSIRLFVVDGTPLKEDMPDMVVGKHVFINPEIIEESEETVSYEEGCLSVPGIHEKVVRPEEIVMHYFDENWVEHTDRFTGFFARMLQHEYDHLEGHVFIDHISSIRRQMVSMKLKKISNGKASCAYKTR